MQQNQVEPTEMPFSQFLTEVENGSYTNTITNDYTTTMLYDRATVPTSKDGLALLGPNYKAAGPHFAFHFDNKKEVENIHKDLKNAGIHVGSIHEHRDGTASFYMRDTEDNWLEMLYVPKGGIKSNV